MNIGSLIRGLLGDNKPGEAKTLELKEGQVVRGVVLSVSDSGKEAVIQIQGTPVRAELESPLQQGQALNFQVGPPGEEGLPVLKPAPAGTQVSAQTLSEALEALGLTDSKAGREIVLAIQAGGLPLTKDTAEQLKAVMDAKPANVPVKEWLEAAVISVKRGLPVTAESVKGIQQAVFGPRLHQLLSVLEEQLNAWIGQRGAESTAVPGSGTAAGPDGGVPAGAGAASPDGSENGNGSSGKAAGTAAPSRGGSGTVGPGRPDPQTGGAFGGNGNNGVQNNEGTEPSTAVKAAAGSGSDRPAVQSPEGGQGNDSPGRSAAGAAPAGLNEVSDTDREGTPALRSQESGAVSAENKGRAPAGRPVTESASGFPAAQSQAPGKTGPAAQPGQGAAAAPAEEPAAAGTGQAAGTLPSDKPALPAEGALRAGGGAQNAAPAPAAAGAQPEGPSALQSKLQGVLHELREAMPQLGESRPQQSGAGEVARPGEAGGQGPAAAALQPQPGEAAQGGAWVARVLKLLGAEHEQLALRGAAAQPGAGAEAAQSAPGASAGDTVKGVLLQALGSGDVPPAVKEAAGQLVQHLTGQQLLMNTDRTAPFAQVTFFLPLKGPDGNETASVHIQSRRGKKGELDASNCRLWFDLDMKALGQTLVDVQVVDRIVSLKLHNDEPFVQELFEGTREELKTAVESIGYQLSSFRTEPLPVRTPDLAVEQAVSQADFVPESYRGVDFRI